MERIFHKKAELLNFEFIDTSSKIFGQNFAYETTENQVILKMDLKNSNDINDFCNYFKELRYIALMNEHIIKLVAKLKELNPNSNFTLNLYFKKYDFKEYKLSFNYNGIKLRLNTEYMEK